MRALLTVICLGLSLLLTSFSVKADTWSVFVYMCGSDLESNYGAATADIKEMIDAKPSDEVTVIIQTGGAQKWQNFGISANKLSRYILKNGELNLLEKLPQGNMGDGRTLYEFLEFCNKYYAADRQILLFWDHGAGSVFGFANDENYGFDSILLSELRGALSSVYGDAPKSKPFELIGFDTCLMATVDTAASIEPFGNYFVASQEIEPGNGWQYTLWLSALANNTNMSTVELGKTICDAYYQGCENEDSEQTATLSLINLNKINPMIKAWNVFGMYALMQASENDAFYAAIGRAASRSENFSNSKSNGYSNMVDMGDFISKVSAASVERHPAADEMQKYLKEAVLYQVSGPAHKASGLSCYYPFDSDQDNYNLMVDNGLINSFILTYGLQHGFIDGDTANSMLQAITSDDEQSSVANVASDNNVNQNSTASTNSSAQDTQSEQADDSDDSEEQSSGGAVDFIANSVNHSVNSALQSLLEQKPEENQDPIAFIQNLIENNVNVISESIAPMHKVDISSLEDQKVDLITKKDGTPAYEMRIDENSLKYIDSVRFYLATLNDKNDVTVFGDDIDMIQDWDKGVFQDNFNGNWPTLDGHLVYLETTADLEDYNYYSIPVILNGVKASIEALYDFKQDKYVVLGARRITKAAMPDKNLIKLKSGDKIVTLMQKMKASDDDTIEVEIDSFILSDKWALEDSQLPDGTYAYMFSMSDIQGNEALSDVAFIKIKDQEITYGDL